MAAQPRLSQLRRSFWRHRQSASDDALPPHAIATETEPIAALRPVFSYKAFFFSVSGRCHSNVFSSKFQQ
jgi:hypothetical protein